MRDFHRLPNYLKLFQKNQFFLCTVHKDQLRYFRNTPCKINRIKAKVTKLSGKVNSYFDVGVREKVDSFWYEESHASGGNIADRL